MKPQKYCSIDLEFTGFNPQVDQILEIGFVFFELSENGVNELEKWSQVFQPAIEVHDKILGLTGLTTSDLSNAPKFSDDHREFLQEKLGDAILVAHNPVLDIKFLESYGLSLSGKSIDTLELAQILLPTHHSYNLENLAHFFSVQEPDAHRALSDALCTIHLLDRLLAKFYGFKPELRNQLLELISKSDFVWRDMFMMAQYSSHELSPGNPPRNNSSMDDSVVELLEIEPNTITSYGLQENLESGLASSLKQSEESSVLVVQSREIAVQLWKAGFGRAIFSEEDLFSVPKFRQFVENATEDDQVKFALKVLVWLGTNWQAETIVDLNLSFFGGQFRSFINGGDKTQNEDGQLLICSYSDLTKPFHSSVLENRRAVIISMRGLEEYFNSGNSKKVSWNMALYLLRSVYNPESDYGQAHLKTEVINAIAATDLFFSLIYILLQRHFPGQRYVTLEQITADDYLLRRIQNMAFNFTEKLRKVSSKADLPTLENFITQVEKNFEISEGIIKWVEVSEYNTTFKNQPLDLASEINQYLKIFNSISFAERYSDNLWLDYLSKRLGVNLKKQTSKDYRSIPCKVVLRPNSESTSSQLGKLGLENLPAVVMFNDLKSVKSFYDSIYHDLNQYSNVLAQGYSGGPNKLFKNFVIKDNSVLLISTDLMLKQHRSVVVKTCLVTTLPSYDEKHPYNAAIIANSEQDQTQLVKTLQLGRVLELLNRVVSKKLKVLHFNYKPLEEELISRIETLN